MGCDTYALDQTSFQVFIDVVVVIVIENIIVVIDDVVVVVDFELVLVADIVVD